MPSGTSTKASTTKIINHWVRIGHRELTKAQNNEGGVHYQNARHAYAKAKRVRHSLNQQ